MTRVYIDNREANTVNFKDIDKNDYFIMNNHLCMKLSVCDDTTENAYLPYDAYDLVDKRAFFMSDKSCVIPVAEVMIKYTVDTMGLECYE